MDIFVFVPAVALGCYLILLGGVLSVKRTKLKRAFVAAVSVYILWVLGSVCMRLDIWPSYAFWFHVSLFGLFLIPCFTLLFMERYISRKNKPFTYVLLASAIVFFVFNLVTNGWFIAPPEQIVTENGTKFVYDIGIQSLIPYLAYVVIMIYLGIVLIQGVKQEKLGRWEFVIIFSGKMLLLLGNILINFEPFKGFPIDMATGIPDALSMCYVFGGNQLVRRYRGTSRGGFRLFVMGATFVLMLCMEKPYEVYLSALLGENHRANLTFIIVVSFLAVFVLAFFLMDRMAERLFIKDEEVQLERLNQFREISHSTLEMEQIQNLICRTAENWLKLEWVGICTWFPRSGKFIMDKPLQDGSIPILQQDNELVRFMRNTEGCVAWGKVPEECKKQFVCLHAAKNLTIIALQDKENLYAIIFIKSKKKLGTSDKRYLELLTEISKDAIHNAELYSQAYWESRTDELTGCGSRKRFFEVLSRLQEEPPNRPISLLLIKPDNFRICNQLYGTAGGDTVLKCISELMRKEACREDTIFRYGSTELLMLLCGYNTEQAKEVAERIRVAVMNITGLMERKQIMLSISIGISTVSEGEVVDNKILDQCTVALYQAQQMGSNCTVSYMKEREEDTVYYKNSLYETYEPVFRALTAAIDAKDHYTFFHSQNVSYYATEIARALRMSAEDISVAKEAGLLHDIGKIGIPEEILNKPGPLNAEEYQIMQGHVEQAVSILRYLSGMEYILSIILGHHERYDGTGYPGGVKGEDNPLLSRVLCIADSFDAMISKRPYKKQYPVHYAIQQLMEGRGTQFDPELVPLFVRLIEDGTIRIRQDE